MMNYQQAFNKGYEAGQLLYADKPNLKSDEVRKQASTTPADIPLTMTADYREGVIAGYEAKKQESEVK